jgi:hypothetical protein
MFSDKVGYISRKSYAVRHKVYTRAFSSIAPYYVVNEFPKSGGSWVAHLLADSLGLPFRRNEPIRLERSVTHGHYLYGFGLDNVVIVWRDPRDVFVSFYYHSYFINEHKNRALVEGMKRVLPFRDYLDIHSNLPKFIRFLTATPLSPRFNWLQFFDKWHGRNDVCHTSYESLREHTKPELVKILEHVAGPDMAKAGIDSAISKNAFSVHRAKAASKTSEAVEMSFVREGSVGGWRKHFSDEALEALSRSGYRERLTRLGYAW